MLPIGIRYVLELSGAEPQLIRLEETTPLPRPSVAIGCHCHLTNHAMLPLWSPIGLHVCHPSILRNYIRRFLWLPSVSKQGCVA